MSNKFVADPLILKQEGGKLLDQAGMFEQNVSKIYDTLEEMLNSSYLSPAARTLGGNIKSFRGDLDQMTAIIREYGSYLNNSGNKVNRNEQAIIDEFNK